MPGDARADAVNISQEIVPAFSANSVTGIFGPMISTVMPGSGLGTRLTSTMIWSIVDAAQQGAGNAFYHDARSLVGQRTQIAVRRSRCPTVATFVGWSVTKVPP